MSKDYLSDEDKALFRQVVQTVKPLKKSKVIVSLPKQTPIMVKKNHLGEKKIPVKQATLYLSDFYADEVESQSILSFCRHSIPAKRLRELKQGKIPWEAKLDLHGLRPEAAQQRLLSFILLQETMQHRSLLIIHGKGSHRGEAPVLKNLVNHWLPQIPQVLAFHSALPREGGAGALYVLLKRMKGLED